MDLNKLNLIKKDILNIPLDEKKKNYEFIGLYVDGTSTFTYEKAAWSIHGFRTFSQYCYPIYLFVSCASPDKEIKAIVSKFSDIRVVLIPSLPSPVLYNEWMFNNCFYLIPEKYQKILSFQEDGGIISFGWEDYVSKKPYSFLGALWKSDIEALSPQFKLQTLKYCNGGVAYRKLSDLLKCCEFVKAHGGQHKFFSGVKINNNLVQDNGWLAEDLMFNAVGHTFEIFYSITPEDCNKFSLEPIELDLFLDKDNLKRPLAFHKID